MRFIPYQSVSGELREEAFDLYMSSFPSHERRSESAHNEALADSEFVAQVVIDDYDELQAIFFYWQHDHMIYVEHIAVNPKLRGQNIGSTVINKFIDENHGKVVILEIDPPLDEVAQRRLRFYSHLGFVSNNYPYVHPSYSVEQHPHDLVLLSHGRQISQSEFDAFVEFMNSKVLKYID